MIESYRMLLNYFAADNSVYKNGQAQINCDMFEDGLIIKNADDRSVVIKTKENPEPNQIKILFYPIKYKDLEKALQSLAKEESCDQYIF